MCRELEFRAWDKIENRMIINSTRKISFHGTIDGGNEFFIIEQWTGLKDKNGVKIFEGDIVKSKVLTHILDDNGDCTERKELTYLNVVEYYNGNTCGWRVRNKSFHRKITENWIFNQKVEIIGNIHQNQELLS